jgi:hypothetical protein
VPPGFEQADGLLRQSLVDLGGAVTQWINGIDASDPTGIQGGISGMKAANTVMQQADVAFKAVQ